MKPLVLALAFSPLLALPAASQSCVSSSPGFEACSGRVLTLEVFENGLSAKPAAWVILTGMKCTAPRPSQELFALADATDAGSFAVKMSLAQLAYARGEEVSVVFPTRPPTGYPHVVRVNVPALRICDGITIKREPTPDLGARRPLVGPPAQ